MVSDIFNTGTITQLIPPFFYNKIYLTKNYIERIINTLHIMLEKLHMSYN